LASKHTLIPLPTLTFFFNAKYSVFSKFCPKSEEVGAKTLPWIKSYLRQNKDTLQFQYITRIIYFTEEIKTNNF
jgi:hypothetical protein